MSSQTVEQTQQDVSTHVSNNATEKVKQEDADGKSTEQHATQSTNLQPADWQSIIDDETGLLQYDLFRKPRTPVTDASTTSIQIRNLNVELTCPICLGILRETMTVMECVHRFCSACINKCLRLGKKECPACRVKCASRRHMRADLAMDGIIAALYPNLEEYEANEESLLDQITQNIIHKGTLGSSIEQGKRRQALAKSNSRNLPPITTPSPKPPKKAAAKKRKTDYSDDEDENESSPEPQPKRQAAPKPSTPSAQAQSGPVEELTFAMMPHAAEKTLPELAAKYLRTSKLITMRHLAKFLGKKFDVDPDSIKLCLQAHSKVAFKEDVTLKQVFEGMGTNTASPTLYYRLSTTPIL